MRRLGAAALLIAAWLAGCGPTDPAPTAPPADPSAAALALFALAAEESPSREQIVLVVEPPLLDEGESSLRDALLALRSGGSPSILAVEELPGLGRVAVDLEAALPEGGSERYSVQARRGEDATWRVVWFEGPGVSWPSMPSPRGDGLTTSPPPGSDAL